MVEVKTEPLYACIIDKTGCSLEDVTNFLNAEIEYWNLEGSLTYDEESKAVTFDSDKLEDYLISHSKLDEETIDTMLKVQHHVVNKRVPLVDQYRANYNIIQWLKDHKETMKKEKEFYDGCLVYGAELLTEILKKNKQGLDKFEFLHAYMNERGNYFDETNGYWIERGC